MMTSRQWIGRMGIGIVAAITVASGCDSKSGESSDASADVASGSTGATTAGSTSGTSAGSTSGTTSGNTEAGADTGSQDGGPDGQVLGGSGVPEARRLAIRACIDARWGAAETRKFLDLNADFEACTTAAEQEEPVGSYLFSEVLTGYAVPTEGDQTVFVRVKKDGG